jgi:hypothetical protein
MSVSLPTAADQLRWICNTSIDDGKQAIKSLLRDRSKHSDAALHEIFSQAMAYEIHNQHRKSLIVAHGRHHQELESRKVTIVE